LAFILNELFGRLWIEEYLFDLTLIENTFFWTFKDLLNEPDKNIFSSSKQLYEQTSHSKSGLRRDCEEGILFCIFKFSFPNTMFSIITKKKISSSNKLILRDKKIANQKHRIHLLDTKISQWAQGWWTIFKVHQSMRSLIQPNSAPKQTKRLSIEELEMMAVETNLLSFLLSWQANLSFLYSLSNLEFSMNNVLERKERFII